MVIGGDMLTQLEMGTRTPDFPQVQVCPELQVPQGTKDAPKMQRNISPTGCSGLSDFTAQPCKKWSSLG